MSFSLSLKGSCEVRILDGDTLEVKRVLKQNNLIPNNTLLKYLAAYGNSPSIPSFLAVRFFIDDGSAKISISTSISTPQETNPTVPNIIATGYVPSGITGTTWDINNNPPYVQIQNRIDQVGTNRTFQTIALTRGASSNNQNINSEAIAYLKLDTPCTQGANEILDLFYRVQFVGSAIKATTRFLKELALISIAFGGDNGNNRFGLQSAARHWHLSTVPFNLPEQPYSDWFVGYPNALDDPYTNSNGGNWTSRTVIDSHFKLRYLKDWALAQNIGLIHNLVIHGYSFQCSYTSENFGTSDCLGMGYSADLIVSADTSPFQSLFSHSASATMPFFDSLKLASGNGKLALSGNWSEKWAQMFKITIAQSGQVGVATYKWSVRRHLGFNGNTYSDRYISNPFLTSRAATFLGQHYNGKVIYKFDDTKIVTYNATGVTLLDQMSGAYQNWDVGTLLGQVAVGNGKIYVACRVSGLYQIEPATNTITKLSDQPCYGVDVGQNNRVFAIFEGRLSHSGNWSESLNFNYMGISDGNWSNAKYLKIDPENANDQLAIVTPTRVVWWNLATETSVNGATDNISNLQFPWCFDVSDTGSFWVSMIPYSISANALTQKHTYGSSTVADLGYSLNTEAVCFEEANWLSKNSLRSPNNTILNSYSDFALMCNMGKGIGYGSEGLRCIYTDNVYIWENYGWDGSNWVLNHPGTKFTHTDDQMLGYGVKVKFQNGNAGVSFVATDYYTQGVCQGIWKDNATTISYQFGLYMKAVVFDAPISTTVQKTVTLPAVTSNANWLRAETDNLSVHNLKIDGNTLVTLYADNSIPPAPNEAILDGVAGTLTFNDLDVGKTLTGTYCYIKK